MKNFARLMSAGLLCGAVAACGGSKEEKKADAKPTQEAMVAAPSQDEMVASCVKMREQLALCKDQAIDMLMNERAKANQELATAWADAAKKTEARTTGLSELDADGGGGDATLPARTDKCKAVASSMPAQIPESMAKMFGNLSNCVDKPCADRVACYQPFMAASLKPAPAAAAPAPAAQ